MYSEIPHAGKVRVSKYLEVFGAGCSYLCQAMGITCPSQSLIKTENLCLMQE